MKKLNELKKSKKGFTLIELIIVIAILGVLAAILVPSLVGTVASSRERVNATNAQTLYSTAQAAYVSLVANGTDVDAATYSSTETNAFVTQIKTDLGNGFNEAWTVVVNSSGVASATYNGKVYTPGATSSTAVSS